MVFRLIVSDTVAVAIKGSIPNAAGLAQPFNYSLVCERLTADALRDVLLDNEIKVTEFMTGLVRDWSGIQGADGQPLDFSPDGLAMLFNIVGMAGVAFQAYLEACGAKGKEKN